MTQPLLLTPYQIAGLTLRNRIVIAPMCQYMAIDGVVNDWQLAHLGRFAIGGAGLIITEMTAIEPRGRITHGCAGIWNGDQARAWSRVVDFVKSQGAAIGIQIAHAGRKGSQRLPWAGNTPLADGEPVVGQPAWETLGPSAIGYGDYPPPHALSVAELGEQLIQWREATLRALDAGFDVVELHGAHGYLIHQFLSPLSNHRTDAYGGDIDGRMRYPLEIVETVRAVWPRDKPMFVRISASDWTEGGWTGEDAVVFAKAMKDRGVDVVHVSTGGNAPIAPPVTLGYQVPFSEQVRQGADIPTIAVGVILLPQQAEDILQAGQADLIAIARAALSEPNWPVRAKEVLDPTGRFTGWSVNSGAVLGAADSLKKRLGLLDTGEVG